VQLILSLLRIRSHQGLIRKQEGFMMEGSTGRFRWLSILVFLLFAGGFSALTVYLTTSNILQVGLGLAVLFAILASIAQAFHLRGEGRVWRFVAALLWGGALIALSVFVLISGWVPLPLGLAVMILIVAGGAFYLLMGRPRETAR
jgi:peptidoglycan/LPS O-acetylase OafA/YrhL